MSADPLSAIITVLSQASKKNSAKPMDWDKLSGPLDDLGFLTPPITQTGKDKGLLETLLTVFAKKPDTITMKPKETK